VTEKRRYVIYVVDLCHLVDPGHYRDMIIVSCRAAQSHFLSALIAPKYKRKKDSIAMCHQLGVCSAGERPCGRVGNRIE